MRFMTAIVHMSLHGPTFVKTDSASSQGTKTSSNGEETVA